MPDDSKVYTVEGIAVFAADPVGRVHTSLGMAVWDGDATQPTGQRIHTALGLVVFYLETPATSPGGPPTQGGGIRAKWPRQGQRFRAGYKGGQRPV